MGFSEKNRSMLSSVVKSTVAIVLLLLAVVVSAPSFSWGDDLDDAKAELEPLVAEVAKLTDRIEGANEVIEELDSSIVVKLAEVEALQTAISDYQRELDAYVVAAYKMDDPGFFELLASSETLSDFIINMNYITAMSQKTEKVKSSLEKEKTELDEKTAEVIAQKDEQVALVEELKTSIAELNAKIEPLKSRISELKSEQKEALYKASGVATTFDTEESDEDTGGEWKTGIASAYGGSTDSAGSRTATGDVCDDWSCGVAIPMSWPNYRSYFGRKIEISYEGKSVIAVVNDCGSMGGGSRSLDLQPGVFKALGGVSSCNGWGLRTVSYRFL